MTIDWAHFTPWASLAGGLILGLAASMFILLNGRILGISGILGGLLSPRSGEGAWRVAFMLGLVASPWVVTWLLPAGIASTPRIDAGFGVIALAGLLVGFGTRMGSGCTSGHGVCGLSRFSPRSLVATLTFMAAGFAIVFVVRHLLQGAM